MMATSASVLNILTICLYIIYLVESLFCATMKYLRNILAVESAQQYIQRIRAVRPSLWMYVYTKMCSVIFRVS
jgi:hypothetical protein